MKKRCMVFLLVGMLAASFLTVQASAKVIGGTKTQQTEEAVSEETTGESEEETEQEITSLEDGIYTVTIKTDSSMFHVNDALDGKGTLTVKDGEMTVHMTLVSCKIVNMYPGTTEEAQQEGAVLLEPVTDTVTYEDGTSEEVYGFDIPVPELGKDFAVAIIGTQGKWYDHQISVTDPQKKDE